MQIVGYVNFVYWNMKNVKSTQQQQRQLTDHNLWPGTTSDQHWMTLTPDHCSHLVWLSSCPELDLMTLCPTLLCTLLAAQMGCWCLVSEIRNSFCDFHIVHTYNKKVTCSSVNSKESQIEILTRANQSSGDIVSVNDDILHVGEHDVVLANHPCVPLHLHPAGWLRYRLA